MSAFIYNKYSWEATQQKHWLQDMTPEFLHATSCIRGAVVTYTRKTYTRAEWNSFARLISCFVRRYYQFDEIQQQIRMEKLIELKEMDGNNEKQVVIWSDMQFMI